MSASLEKDLLWDELGLDTLLARGPAANDSILNEPKSLLLGGSQYGVVSSVPKFQPIFSSKNENNELKPLSNIIQDQVYAQQGMKKVMTNHKKMLEKPTYAAIMDRYGSLPHKPKVISKTKLSELADPVLGKLSSLERKELDRIQKLQEMEERAYRYVPNKKDVVAPSSSQTDDYQNLYEHLQRQQKHQENLSKHPYEQTVQQNSTLISPSKNVNYQSQPITECGHDDDDEAESSYDEGALFLTESNKRDSRAKIKNQFHNSPVSIPQSMAQPVLSSPLNPHASPQRDTETVAAFLERLKSSPHDKIDMNIKSSKNGFASMLRDRISFAQKIEKIAPGPMGKKKKIDENDVVSAYQRYAVMKKEREKQMEAAKKIARSKPPKIPPKMNKKTSEVMTKQENVRKSVPKMPDPVKKNIAKKKEINSSGYGKEVKRYSVHPKPPSYSKSKKLAVPSLSTREVDRKLSRAANDLTEEEELMMSNESLGGSSDDEMMSNTFLTGMIKTNNHPKMKSLSDRDTSTGMSKAKSKLRSSIEQRLPPISSIPEKPASSSKLLEGRKGSQRKRIAEFTNRDSGGEHGVMAASSSAPSSSRAMLRQQLKQSHRSNSTPSIAQSKQKAVKPENRFNQLKAMLEESDIDCSDTLPKRKVEVSSKTSSLSNFEGEIDSLNSQNNYGKRRSMQSGVSGKLPSNKSGALQIPLMPRSMVINGGNNPSIANSNKVIKDIENGLEFGDIDALLQNIDSTKAPSVLQAIENYQDNDVSEDKVDIHSMITRLKKYEGVQLKGTSDLYVKPDTNASLVKHAERIGGHFSNIDAMMEKINALKDGLE